MNERILNILCPVSWMVAIAVIILFWWGIISLFTPAKAETLPTPAPDPDEWAVTLTQDAEDKPKKSPTPTPKIIYWTSTATPNPYPVDDKVYPVTANPSPRWFDWLFKYFGGDR